MQYLESQSVQGFEKELKEKLGPKISSPVSDNSKLWAALARGQEVEIRKIESPDFIAVVTTQGWMFVVVNGIELQLSMEREALK